MATYTLGSSGRDYTSFTALAAAEGDFAPGEDVVVECYADSNFDEYVSFAAWNSVNSLTIRPAPGQSPKHVLTTGSTNPVFNFDTANVEFNLYDWEIDENGQNNKRTIRIRKGTIARCYFHGKNTSRLDSRAYLSLNPSANCTLRILNCLIDGGGTGTTTDGIVLENVTDSLAEFYIDNNTIVNVTGIGITNSNDNTNRKSIQNNIVLSTTGAAFSGTFTSTVALGYNFADDDTEPGSNGGDVVTGDFTNFAGGDFSVATGAVWKASGVDLGSNADRATDITGRNRDSEGDTWSPGAYQYVAVNEITRIASDVTGDSNTGATSVSCALTGVSVGNTIVVITYSQLDVTHTVSDNLSHTWNTVLTESRISDIGKSSIQYATITTGGDCTITLTTSGASRQAIVAVEYSGIASSSPVEDFASTNGSSLSPNSGASTLSANSVLIGAVICTNSKILTPDASLSVVENDVSALRRVAVLESNVPSGGDYNVFGSLDTGGSWIATAAGFLIDSGGDSTAATAYYRSMLE